MAAIKKDEDNDAADEAHPKPNPPTDVADLLTRALDIIQDDHIKDLIVEALNTVPEF